MKACTQCGKDKPVEAYARSKHTDDGLRPMCEDCYAGRRSSMEENDAECGKCGKRLNHYNTGEVGEQAICHPCQTGLVGEIPKWLGDLADGVDKQQINTLAQMWMDSRSVGWLNR